MSDKTLEGLIMKGTVTGRSRRFVGEKNLELVTYKILAGEKIFFIKEWTPKEYFSVGEAVALPINIKSYQKNGHVMIDYTIINNLTFGDEF